MLTLKAEKREVKRNLKKIREEGKLPAVFYGAGKKSTPVVLNEKDFQKVWKEAGESTAIKLSTKEGDIDALIHDVQFDPVRGNPIHADFLVIDINKPVQTNVPLRFDGEAPAVKSGLGTLVKVLHELHIEALPKNLPHEIKVDISRLKTLEDQILVKDVILPLGVTSITKEEEVVALVSHVQEEVEEEVVPEVDLSAIEVEKKGKKEEEEGEIKAEAGKEEKAEEKKAE